MTPEQNARVSIYALLVQGGHVCGVSDANIHAAMGVAIRAVYDDSPLCRWWPIDSARQQ